MIASIPAAALPEVVEGLKQILKHGHGLPLVLSMKPEYDLPAAYVKIGRMMGMDWVR